MMKQIIVLVFAMILTAGSLKAGVIEMRELTRKIGSNSYSDEDATLCSAAKMTLRIRYDFCPDNPSVDCAGGCGKYRVTLRLYRNGALVANTSQETNDAWLYWQFFNLPIVSGEYKAHVKLERDNGLFCLGDWSTVSEGFTNSINITGVPTVPNFNLNGQSVPPPGSPSMSLCGSNIQMNAGSSKCESKYYIGVQECDAWWIRTYEYEWGVWFSGQAPNNINLQGMAATYSNEPWFSGTDPSREGEILYGGYLSTGQKRHYRVNLCLSEPSWQCKTALVNVSAGCFDGSGDPDDNEYVVIYNEDDIDTEIFDQLFAETPSTTTDEPIDLELGEIVPENRQIDIQVQPNPFSSFTTINLNQTYSEPVTVELFNTIGQQVKVVSSMDREIRLERGNLASGIYFYKIRTNEELLKSGKLMIE